MGDGPISWWEVFWGGRVDSCCEGFGVAAVGVFEGGIDHYAGVEEGTAEGP